MKFRTEFITEKSSLTLKPWQPIVMTGSCFTENIAGKMRGSLWDAVNVTGTLFNPLSIVKALELILLLPKGKSEEIFRDSLFETDGVWKSWLFDSAMTGDSPEDCMAEFSQRCQTINESLEFGKTLVVTFGSNVCYFLQRDNFPVGNCHKQQSTIFYNKGLSIEEITTLWKKFLQKLKSRFEDIDVIFTISPVRYIKYGFDGNSLSKAVLRLSIDEICNRFEFCYYFPAFEILNDDLRDYRFYASDLVHPSQDAIDYIWQKFQETYLNEEGLELLKKGESIVKGLNHQLKPSALGKIPSVLQEKEYRRLENLKSEYKSLLSQYPHLLSLNT